ncbi:hypothetical protein [Gimesia algae]|uniref:Phage virion morphogenesis family protein n=1 Tax=Gimesia algae TaxID=2527971 RepID=A0A517VMM0_9PLAN|nr:hypothetical protein [Gimesia algae]QDT94267.1 hypothetical protein Pan161_59620 [Gimesia algae]
MSEPIAQFKVTGAVFQSEKVLKQTTKARRRFAYWAGGLVKTIIRRKFKVQRMKRLGEMSEKEKESYKLKIKIAKRLRKPKPKRPKKPSDPGEPPRLTYKESPLKYLVEFAVTKDFNSVIGPKRAKSGIAGVLEHGGVSNGRRIAARPFAQPSLEDAAPQLDDYWKDKVGE